MGFVDLFKDAWRLTWNNRWLWIFGLFAGSSGGGFLGGGGNYRQMGNNFDQAGMGDFNREMAKVWLQVGAFLREYAGVILTIFLVIAIVAFLLFLLSVICQGTVIAAGAALAEGRPAGAGIAWRRAMAVFGRMFVFGLIVWLGWLAISAVLIGIVVLSLQARSVSNPFEWLASLAPIVTILGLASNVVAVFVGFGQRAIVLDDLPMREAAEFSYRLIRQNALQTGIAWLVGLVGGILLGIVFAFIMLATFIVAAIPGGIGIYLLVNESSIGLPFLLIGVLILAAVLLVGTACFHTFILNYWTMVYLRLKATPAPPTVELAKA
jgi:hypothetical protein